MDYPTENWNLLPRGEHGSVPEAANIKITSPTGSVTMSSPPSAASVPAFVSAGPQATSVDGRAFAAGRAGGVIVPQARIARYTTDDPYSIADDLLDVEDEAEAFARIAAARSIQPPLAIGIFGEWGAGKTYFMRRVEERVNRLRELALNDVAGRLYYKDIVQIRFNAWHYIETNLWASLVEYIFSALDSWMRTTADAELRRPDLVFDRTRIFGHWWKPLWPSLV